MPNGQEREVVLDAFTLLGGLTSDAERYATETQIMAGIQLNCTHKLVITEPVRRGYEATSQRLGSINWQADLRGLVGTAGDKIRGRATGRRHPVNPEGLPKAQQGYLRAAIQSQAEFFVTRNERWLGIRARIAEEHKVRILAPEEYLGELDK